jgi:ribosomal protein S8E
MKMQTTTITRGAIICRDSESGSLASGGGVVVGKRKREGGDD